MDRERQIRFLYPPFFTIFSVLLALYLDDTRSLQSILPNLGTETKAVEIIAALLGGGIIVIILGFIIGTITINLLRFFFWIFRIKHYEEHLTEETYKKIFDKVNIKNGTKEQRFYSVVTFDHEIVSSEVHQWNVRRWNSFNISANSLTALILSIPITFYLNINFHCIWIIFIPIICILSLVNAVIAWKQTMAMIEFQSRREQLPGKNKSSNAS